MPSLCFLLVLVSLSYWTCSYATAKSHSESDSRSFGKVISDSSLRFSWDEIEYVYAFGDSYSFVQGTRGLANFSFIGDFQELGFTNEQLLTDEIIFRNVYMFALPSIWFTANLSRKTSSDGANWLEFLTGCFSGRPINCTPRQLWDFAFAGADIDGNLLPLHHPYTVPLVDQVNQWATFAAGFLPRPTKRTLTAWWIGINDTGDSTGNETIADFHAFYAQEMDSFFSAVELAHSNGLDGAHLFLTVPPEERSPSGLISSSAAAQKANIEDYNAQLLARAEAFAQNHTDTPVLVFDAHKWFNFALNNSAALGFTNITGYCECTDPGFFWYNTGHPTEHTHRLLASALDEFLTNISA